MKKILIISGLLLSLGAFSQSGEKNFIDQNYIEVRGKAELQVVPDLIYMTVVLKEQDVKSKSTVPELEKKMFGVFEKLGIDTKKDVSVMSMSSNYKDYFLKQDDINLVKQFQVVVHDGKTAGLLMIELEKVNISNIYVTRREHSQMTEFRKEVKMMAVKAAKEKADYLAEAIGQEAGRAIYIQELDSPQTYKSRGYMANSNTVMMADESDFVSDTDFEKIKLEYSVFCRFELK